ncbi:MAG: hypothetical protein ACP5OG_04935 [Candidatus Nanoarchaeia archaeon]
MAEIIFKTNAKKELEYLKLFAKFCGTKKIKKEYLELLALKEDNAINIIKQGYKSQEFLDFVKDLKKEWKAIEKRYFNELKKFTKQDLEYNSYKCYLSLSVPGLADLFDNKYNKLILSNIYPAKTMKYVLAHELFHLHYFYSCKKMKMPPEAADIGVNESIPILFMLNNPKLSKLWQDITLDRVRNSYAEVNRIIDPLIKYYESEKNFKKLIQKAIELNNK